MTLPELPQPVADALSFFREEHDPAAAPFVASGDNVRGLLIYIPAGLPPLNLHTVVQAVQAAYAHPDRLCEFVHDLEARHDD
ncbi:hypothetical protein [Deinococcus soli (ex Cha et al. 2016)]|uniref:hypothetical protein n=1 Tax=Deinococcus soli (ex Cha et al. 2016) TaxID=1309411 RepID=UPI0016690308|nr:hypothetical protein [Deinococcus soli (ex Cha et al. 2016)]GGB64725.1 hypothetical protein GCM10008019_21060 [Deinococcus soli (ex Cha et al. 2016)]